MKSNVQLFRECMKEQIPSQQIQTLQEFKELMDYLCDNKLLHPLEVKKLQHRFADSKDIKFPINFQQLEQIIMTQFGDKHFMDMLDSFDELRLKLRQVKGVLNIWKDKGLSSKQRYELQSIFQHGNLQMRQLFQRLKKEQEVLGTIYQQEQQMIDSLEEWIHMQKIQQDFKDYKEYQKVHGKMIQQSFNQLRVREIHFKQRVNSAKVNKIERVVALDSKNDEPVEVTLVPKKNIDMDELNMELLTFNARKQLMLSSHFPRFLGYNTHSDPHCFHYFSEFTDGVNFAKLVTQTEVQLEENTPIFQYWAYQLYETFLHLYLMSSYVVLLPLKLDQFVVANGGLRIAAKSIKFVDFREENESEYYQAELLENLGQLLLSLLRVDPEHWSKQVKVKQIDNKNILSCLLRAKIGHQHFRAGRVKHYLSFFNMQTHPLLEAGKEVDGETVLDNFEAIKAYS